jgi:branched-chain amino acid transport system ATP-binding protein
LSLLDIRKINCSYDSTQVLWNVSLTVDEKELVAIVGSNGAGKTTLLRAICGLQKLMAGDILWKEHQIGNLPPHRIVEEGISQIPEGGGVFPFMTVLDNLKAGAYVKKHWMKRQEHLKQVFAIFPVLNERRNQLAGTLSGGERQMLGIAKGLMSSPQLLIFDEPSLGLSPLMVLNLWKIIKDISSQGTTILLVEQNVHHAMNLSSRAYVLENGHIVRSGYSETLLADDHLKKVYLGM